MEYRHRKQSSNQIYKRETPEQLQKRYLDVLASNDAATRTLNELQQQQQHAEQNVPNGCDEGQSGGATTFIALLNQRRHHDKWQVVHRHADRLSQECAAQAHFLDIHPQNPILNETDQGIHSELETLGSETESIEVLTTRLEHAVLKAKHQLAREKELLAKITDMRTKTTGLGSVSPSQTLRGLNAVQIELFTWIESRLAESQEAETQNGSRTVVSSCEHDAVDMPRDLGAQTIQAKYQLYLKSRQRLLHAVSLATRETGSPRREAAPGPSDEAPIVETLTPQPILPFIEKQLLPLIQANEETVSISDLLYSTLDASRNELVQTLDRLADESHLLEMYTLHSQSRGASRLKPSSNTIETPNAVRDKVEAWAFASASAASSTKKIVTGQLEEGEHHLQQAHGQIGQVRKLLGETQADEHSEDSEEDIWAGDIRTERQRTHQARQRDQAAGPWGGLNGKLDLDETATVP